MKFFDKKSALKAFYYLMAVDGDVSSEELVRFDEIGKQIDLINFFDIRSGIIAECEAGIGQATDEDYYERIVEALDMAMDSADIYDKVSSRLVIWDMLSIAFSNGEYSESEKKLIRHIARITEIDNSILLEMEQYIKAELAVEQELEFMKQSDKPYSYMSVIVDELEERQRSIIEDAKALVEDEVLEPIELPKATFMQRIESATGNAVNTSKQLFQDKVMPTASKIGESAKKAFGEAKSVIGEKSAPTVESLKQGTGKLLGSLKDKVKGGK